MSATKYTAGNLRASITALLADEESGCDRRHLDALLEKLVGASNRHDELVNLINYALPVLVDERDKHPTPEWDSIVREFRAALAKVSEQTQTLICKSKQ